jgi:hypothetical protein
MRLVLILKPVLFCAEILIVQFARTLLCGLLVCHDTQLEVVGNVCISVDQLMP